MTQYILNYFPIEGLIDQTIQVDGAINENYSNEEDALTAYDAVDGEIYSKHIYLEVEGHTSMLKSTYIKKLN